MKGKELLEKMELIDSAYIEAASVAPRKKRYNTLKAWVAISACIVLIISATLGAYAYAKETKRYNDAVAFFDDYDLKTDGLSRTEIKRVYRDIVTKSFSYSKTSEVIINSMSSEQLSGYEILQENITSEYIENLWNYKNYSGALGTPDKMGVRYSYYSEYKRDDALGFDVHDKSYLEKYDGEELVWRTEISEFTIDGYEAVSDGVIAYGNTYRWSTEQPSYAWLMKVDTNGNVVWKQALNSGFEVEWVSAIIETETGGYSVISRGDYEYICLSKFTASGKRESFNKTKIGNYGIFSVVRSSSGYIVQLGSHMTSEHAKILKLDEDGNVKEAFVYGEENVDYYITDMVEYDGKIYLSAYAVPKHESKNEIGPVLEHIFENNIIGISSEKLTPLLRQNYTALLLVCDSKTGTPKEFYSVSGSLGGELDVSEAGELVWDVESITSSFFSPYTNAYTVTGTCYVFRYTFDTEGALKSQQKTDEITSFWR